MTRKLMWLCEQILFLCARSVLAAFDWTIEIVVRDPQNQFIEGAIVTLKMKYPSKQEIAKEVCHAS